VFRETLRLYPPVPMMVRQTARPEMFRNRPAKPGAQVVISPWHLHRHTRLWKDPDLFDPDRWARAETKASAREAYIPFSAGPRVCSGAGFAMLEGVLLLAMLCRTLRFRAREGAVPVPVAHLTVRARDGIYLEISKR
jgi:cytochrome P450